MSKCPIGLMNGSRQLCSAGYCKECLADLKARGFAREGGVLICDYCGFAIIVEGPRECCPKGITHDLRRGLPV